MENTDDVKNSIRIFDFNSMDINDEKYKAVSTSYTLKSDDFYRFKTVIVEFLNRFKRNNSQKYEMADFGMSSFIVRSPFAAIIMMLDGNCVSFRANYKIGQMTPYEYSISSENFSILNDYFQIDSKNNFDLFAVLDSDLKLEYYTIVINIVKDTVINYHYDEETGIRVEYRFDELGLKTKKLSLMEDSDENISQLTSEDFEFECLFLKCITYFESNKENFYNIFGDLLTSDLKELSNVILFNNQLKSLYEKRLENNEIAQKVNLLDILLYG